MIDIRCCDNLELMSQISDNTIDLIYCDILYGTGKKFKDYQDLKPKRRIIEEHYIPRIKEMHRILKDTGSIYLQMDYKISHWIRCIMDDIFGYNNMRNEIIWCYNTQGSSENNFAYKHDNILYYVKAKRFIWNPKKQLNYSPFMANRENSKKYGGHYNKNGLWMTYVNMRNYWDDIYVVRKRNNAQYVGYETQKPLALIERIIKASSNEGDLVADFYLGSGTTAEVCKKLNRNFIGCDISETAIQISKERVQCQ